MLSNVLAIVLRLRRGAHIAGDTVTAMRTLAE